MLIPNITTEFKDSNGTLRVVWDYNIGVPTTVVSIHHIHLDIINCGHFYPIIDILTYKQQSELIAKLQAWAAPQTIEQLKAKLAF